MFTLSIYGITKVYSTERNAERAAAHFVNHYHSLGLYRLNENDAREFSELLQREDYKGCVTLWNRGKCASANDRVNIAAATIDAEF